MMRFKSIYLFAPAAKATGGPELIHQLAYKLKERGMSPTIVYTPKIDGNPVHQSYEKYGLDWSFDFLDEEGALLVVPETQSAFAMEVKNAEVCIWWQSVDNYYKFHESKVKSIILRLYREITTSPPFWLFENKLRELPYHFAQSEYAKQHLLQKGVDPRKIFMLSDYLSSEFLDVCCDRGGKEDVIAYNPSKGMKYTRMIIDAYPSGRFIAIENMSKHEVITLLKRAKVYLDFGPHPGKDRIPREAALMGCCVITNRKGSAFYEEDVGIPESYKFDSVRRDLSNIVSLLDAILKSYDSEFLRFSEYIDGIRSQELKFDTEVETICESILKCS